MQRGSRFSVFRCVKTRRLQTISLSKIESLPVRPIVSRLPRMRDMQVSQSQRDFAQLRNRERISLSRAEPTYLASPIGLGPRLVDSCTGAYNSENPDIVGP